MPSYTHMSFAYGQARRAFDYIGPWCVQREGVDDVRGAALVLQGRWTGLHATDCKERGCAKRVRQERVSIKNDHKRAGERTFPHSSRAENEDATRFQVLVPLTLVRSRTCPRSSAPAVRENVVHTVSLSNAFWSTTVSRTVKSVSKLWRKPHEPLQPPHFPRHVRLSLAQEVDPCGMYPWGFVKAPLTVSLANRNGVPVKLMLKVP